ncbi:hypothetical protein LGL73_13740, partial [Staphylococcus aureus]|uniref:hypothetical protein n=1 Tax=Staphylococcus aureus TaxID=1280 RepID=UPI001CF2912C|nr:hypothetical protein [Staphylococcus aureus]
MPNQGKPRFKSKKSYKPTFSTDRARLVNGKLVLDKPQRISKSVWYGIKLRETPRFEGKLKLCTITQKSDGYYASLVFDTSHNEILPKTHEIVGIDVNIRHFNYNDGQRIDIYPKKLERYYQRITHYQQMLARKRLENPHNFKTKRYTKVKTKLRRDYQKVTNLQKN